MPAPTPTSPTLNDLEYYGYNQAGFQNVTTVIPGDFVTTSDAVITKENVVLNFVGYTGLADTSDVLNTSENVVVTIDTAGPNQYVINTSDTVTTAESIDVLRAGARNVTVSDTTTTSENIVTG